MQRKAAERERKSDLSLVSPSAPRCCTSRQNPPRLIWGRFVVHQDLQSVLRCHIAALKAIGGVPHEILYDRMKTAVIGEDADGLVVYNRALVDLARHYGFQPRACRPYRPKTSSATPFVTSTISTRNCGIGSTRSPIVANHKRYAECRWLAAPTPKNEKMPAVRIALERLLNHQGEAIHAAAHVGMARCDPHPHTGTNGNHRRGSTFITAAARSGSTTPEIRRRTPRPNSNSISGMPAGAVGGIAGSLGSDRAIATGVKPMGVDVGAAKPSVSQYCLRQPNRMLRLILCRRATPLTVWPSTNVSATSARFSSSLQRRRVTPYQSIPARYARRQVPVG